MVNGFVSKIVSLLHCMSTFKSLLNIIIFCRVCTYNIMMLCGEDYIVEPGALK